MFSFGGRGWWGGGTYGSLSKPRRGWRFSKGKVIEGLRFAPCSDQKSMWVPGTMKEVMSQSLIDGGNHSCSELVLGLGEGGDCSNIRLSEKSVSRSVSRPDSSSQTWRHDSSLLVASTKFGPGMHLLSQRC